MTVHRDDWKDCEQCGRTVIEEGRSRRIEAAFDRDGLHPAVEFLDKVLNGKMPRASSAWFYDLMIRIEEYCDIGTLVIPDQLNQLSETIWEIKAQKLRVPFHTADENPIATDRATHGFVKGTVKAPLREIDRAEAIRREDIKQ